MKIASERKFACCKCGNSFVFSDKWAKKNADKEFICRACKIKASWTPEKRAEAKVKSEEKLSSVEVKKKMSMMATISNSKNAEKISSSLKKHFSENGKKAITPKAESIAKIKSAIKEKWQDDNYRAKILVKRWEKQDSTLFRFSAKERRINAQLIKAGVKFVVNHFLSFYEFKFFVNEKILIDTDNDPMKKLFVEQYFPHLEYRTDWK